MVVKTRNPVNRNKLQQNTVVTTANGLPVDSVVDLQGTNRLIYDTTTTLSYVQPVVTVDPSVDLSIVKNFSPRYTGNVILIDALNQIYYVDKLSINVVAGTFDIYLDPEFVEPAPSIDTKKGWVLAEGKLVNKMSVTSAAHIDEVHFNGFDLNLELDGKAGDSVSVVNPVTGVPMEIEPDGSTNVNCEIDAEDGDSIMVVGTEDGTPTGTQHTIKTEIDGTISRTDLDSTQDNVLIVGTEDGTFEGTQRVVKLENDGKPDIRNLDQTRDNVQVRGSNNNSIEPNLDGSINTKFEPGSQLDAFGRQRVSNPANIFEFKFNTDTSFDFYFDQRNLLGGTQTQLGNNPARELAVTSTAGSTAVLQSRRYIEYTVGKSQQIFITGNFQGGVAGVEKCYGTYDDSNGAFFKLNGLLPEVVLRSKVTGTVVDNSIPRTLWNGDKLDGTGASGETIDFSIGKELLMFIDYAWLGVGDVRMGFFINGQFIIAHTFRSSNILTTAYSQSGNLPIRAEVLNTSGIATTLTVTCASVAVEGDKSRIGRVRSYNTGSTAVTFNTTETFVFGLKLNSEVNSALEILNFDLLPATGNTQAIFRIYYNPTLTGATWTPVPNSIAEVATNQPVFTGGLLLSSGYLNLDKQSAIGSNRIAVSDIFGGRDIDGVADAIILTMQTLSGNGSSNFAGSWKEYL